MSDAEARERAACDYARNVVVVAGAGTGKTTLLVERLLRQMVETDLAIDRFAAITFTEKAAAELRERLGAELARLARLGERRGAGDAAPAQSAASRAYRALRARGVSDERIATVARDRRAGLARAQLSTIHAFCAGLLRRHPLECEIDPAFSVDSGLGFEALKDELWSAYLAGPHGPDGSDAPRWRRVLMDLDSGEVEALARALASFAPAAQAATRGLPDPRTTLGALASDALARIAACVGPDAEKGPEAWLAAAREVLAALRGGMATFREALEAARWRNHRTCGAGGTSRAKGRHCDR